jgi:hypothetical protein
MDAVPSPIACDEIIGRRVLRVLQSPYEVSEYDPEGIYCSFYLLLESGLLIGFSDKELWRAVEPVSKLIDAEDFAGVDPAGYLRRTIVAVACDCDRYRQLVLIFEGGNTLEALISMMRGGNYLGFGTRLELAQEKWRSKPLVDYWDGIEIPFDA